MAYEISPYSVKITLVAGADLSAAQYTFVKVNGSGQAVACAAITDIPVGVLQNAPLIGQEAEVLVSGGTKVKAAAAATTPTLIGTNATGLAQAIVAGTATTVYVAGQYLTAPGAANEFVTAIVDCTAPGRAS